MSISTYPPGSEEPLMAEGKLPHETSLPFRRNILSIARQAANDGVHVVLMTLPARPGPARGEFWRYGIEENNQHLRELAAEHGFLLVDAARAFEARPELVAHFVDLVHLEVPGNQVKADLIADALAAKWLPGLSPDGARPPQGREQ